MLIILEGPDACGKTTLAKAIQAQAPKGDVVYVHHTYVDPKLMWDYFTDSLDAAERLIKRGKVVIFDRFWPSEIVYAEVYRGGSKIKAHVRALHRWVNKLGGVYVWCAPDPQVAVDNHAKMAKTGREFYKPDERIRKVAEMYRQIYSQVGYVKVCRGLDVPRGETDLDASLFGYTLRQLNNSIQHTYDFTRNGYMVNEIAYRLLENAYSGPANPALARIQNVVGSCDPWDGAPTLVVGETYNQPTQKSRPFVHYRGSSGYMNELLEESGLDESHVTWTNALDDHFKLVLRNFLAADNRNLKIVTLGNVAMEEVAKLTSKNVVNLVHPAFAKRFVRDKKAKVFAQRFINELRRTEEA